MTISIRPAHDTDAEAVFALAKPFATSFAVDEQAFHRSFSALLASPQAHLAVAETDQQLVGYVLGFDHDTFFANGRVAWVEELMVSELSRRQGIGHLLMQAFEAWAVARGCKLVALATRRAAAFYQAMGYEESATYFRKLLELSPLIDFYAQRCQHSLWLVSGVCDAERTSEPDTISITRWLTSRFISTTYLLAWENRT